MTPDREKLNQACNAFYRLVRRVKRECWQRFLIGNDGANKGDITKVHSEDKNQYWKALQYTKSRTNRTSPALRGPNNKVAITMHDKEALVRAHAFPKPPIFEDNEYSPRQGSAHLSVSIETVAQVLFCQSIKKAPGPNIHNF